MAYFVRLRPGCYGEPEAPTIAERDDLAEAVRIARSSDRYRLETADGTVLWVPPKRASKHGSGLYGTGPQRGEPPVSDIARALARKLGVQR